MIDANTPVGTRIMVRQGSPMPKYFIGAELEIISNGSPLKVKWITGPNPVGGAGILGSINHIWDYEYHYFDIIGQPMPVAPPAPPWAVGDVYRYTQPNGEWVDMRVYLPAGQYECIDKSPGYPHAAKVGEKYPGSMASQLIKIGAVKREIARPMPVAIGATNEWQTWRDHGRASDECPCRIKRVMCRYHGA